MHVEIYHCRGTAPVPILVSYSSACFGTGAVLSRYWHNYTVYTGIATKGNSTGNNDIQPDGYGTNPRFGAVPT